MSDRDDGRFQKYGDTPSDLLRRAAAARRIAEDVLNPADKSALCLMASELEAEALRREQQE